MTWDRRSLLGERNKSTEEREGQAAFYLYYFQIE